MAVDRAYANILSHLQQPSSRLPLQTVFSAVTHYLSHLPLPHPTQLTAFVISSSLWQPPSVEGLWSLSNAFRSAVHLKQSNIRKESSGLFSGSSESLLREWICAVMKGANRGDTYLRIAILGGLLLGLEDLRRGESRPEIRKKVEGQIVIACAEVLEILSTTQDAWKNEFTTRGSDSGEDMNETLFLYMACQILPLVSSSRFRALDLSALIYLSKKAIKKVFLGGDFLSNLSRATTQEPNGQINILSETTLSNSLRSVDKDPLYQTAGPLAKLLSRALSQLTEVAPIGAWQAFYDTSEDMESMVCQVERDWKESHLASVVSEQDIGPQSRELSTEIWTILKTLLFSQVLVSQSILSSIPYMRPLSAISPNPGPSSIARSVLHSLHHLSFVLSRFGGVTSSAEGFKELKRVFYMALDIVAADADSQASNSFVEELLSNTDIQPDLKHPFWQAKTAYTLAIVEQLVPVLSDWVLENWVILFCRPYLADPQNRETYESAHSVVLSIFAAHAQRVQGKPASEGPSLAERLVPFYVNSLIENSSEGRLSRDQLKLAYSSLVRSAASSGDDALAWLCVDTLLSRINASASDPPRPMDLYVTFVSLISCVPLSLLLRELGEVEKILDAVDGEDRHTLADVVLDEVTSRVGDREREVTLSWWCNVAPRFDVQEEGVGD